MTGYDPNNDDASRLVEEVLGPGTRIVDRRNLGSRPWPLGVERLFLDSDFPGIGRSVVANGHQRGIVCFGAPHERRPKRVGLEVLRQAGVHLAPRVLAGSWLVCS